MSSLRNNVPSLSPLGAPCRWGWGWVGNTHPPCLPHSHEMQTLEIKETEQRLFSTQFPSLRWKERTSLAPLGPGRDTRRGREVWLLRPGRGVPEYIIGALPPPRTVCGLRPSSLGSPESNIRGACQRGVEVERTDGPPVSHAVRRTQREADGLSVTHPFDQVHGQMARQTDGWPVSPSDKEVDRQTSHHHLLVRYNRHPEDRQADNRLSASHLVSQTWRQLARQSDQEEGQ